jgi:hypothetical protein
MKKAKQYSEEYAAAGKTPEKLAEIWIEFFKEANELINIRKAITDSASLAIFDELDRKWKAFARMNPEVNPDGFMEALSTQFPDLAESINMQKSFRNIKTMAGRAGIAR